MHSFKNDYSEGAHPRILNALIESNLIQAEGYGEDEYSLAAAKLLKEIIKCPEADIHFFSGGTQTNLTAISAFLRPHEAAIAANTGHILVHETGAIEATGHKVVSIEVSDGKIGPQHIDNVLKAHTDEHMVKPRLVYLSNPTELGSIYTKSELEKISRFCRENRLFLYIDGARLGSALCASGNDVGLPDLARLADSFYIGGTKNGALLGEALIIRNNLLKNDFRYQMKQKGALMAKGRVLGIQFLELFKDGLYFDLARHANNMAEFLGENIKSLGYKLLIDSKTNQIFPVLPDRVIAKLEEKYSFYVWAKEAADASSIRLVTSWATRQAAVEAFIEDLKRLSL